MEMRKTRNETKEILMKNDSKKKLKTKVIKM